MVEHYIDLYTRTTIVVALWILFLYIIIIAYIRYRVEEKVEDEFIW